MKMIQVLSNTGWHDYCPVGLLTDFVDIDGVELQTGDCVEILHGRYFADPAIPDDECRIGTAMVVADIDMKFIRISKPFIAGWLKHDWSDGEYLLRKIPADQHTDDTHHRIIDSQ